MQSNRGRPLTTSGSKFNQLAIPIIGLRLDRQRLRARWLALEPGIVGWGNHFGHAMRWEQGISDWFPAVVLLEVMRALLRDVRNQRLGLFLETAREQISADPHVEPARFAHCSAIESSPKSCGQLLGESWPRAIRSGTGRGGDVTGSRVLLFPVIDRGRWRWRLQGGRRQARPRRWDRSATDA